MYHKTHTACIYTHTYIHIHTYTVTSDRSGLLHASTCTCADDNDMHACACTHIQVRAVVENLADEYADMFMASDAQSLTPWVQSHLMYSKTPLCIVGRHTWFYQASKQTFAILHAYLCIVCLWTFPCIVNIVCMWFFSRYCKRTSRVVEVCFLKVLYMLWSGDSTNTYIYIYIYMYIHTYIHTYIRFLCMHECIIHTCIRFVCMHVCMRVSVCMYAYTYIYACVHICTFRIVYSR
jgi:hypothetical protein